MADTFSELMSGVIAALRADVTIAAIVGARIYSDVPQNEVFPYMVVNIQSTPFDTKTSNGMTHNLQVSSFDRGKTTTIVANLRKATYNLLHEGESNVTISGATLISMLFTGLAFVAKEPDGVTWQSTIQFNAIIDET